MANPLADAALEGLQIGREEGERTAKLDKLEATGEWVDNWRRNNGVGPNVTPSKDVVPFKWMHPFLHKVEGPEGDLMIAGDPSFKIGGGKSGSRKNKAIMKNADVGTPNAKEFMDKLNLGPSMFPVDKAQNGLPQEQLMAGRPNNMPEYIYESMQRQYGNKKYGDYTIEDKKNVINWFKKA